ncbi:MAG: peptidoglycan bridge formation glycyltransferase FemA/FemB family protein [Anaerolineales bacterium]
MAIAQTIVESKAAWDAGLQTLPEPHLLQSWVWGEVKATTGWAARRFLWKAESGAPVAAAQVLEREVGAAGIALRVMYCPKGPLLDWGDESLRRQVLADLQVAAAGAGVLQIKMDPDVPVGFGVPGEENERPAPMGPAVKGDLQANGWRPSPESIQFRNTMILDISPSNDEILAAMKQKTRYNVRLAGRRGVDVRRGGIGDLELLYQMYAETSVRDGFVIRSAEYYRQVWGRFINQGMAQPLIAEVDGEPVAAVIPFKYGQRAWYLYGMSTEQHREKMPNYLLQWEAIDWAKDHDCTSYDLWGAPDVFDRSDPMWGVYRFKRGFQAEVLRTIGPWDYAPSSWRYAAYHRLLPWILRGLRLAGRRQTRSDLE